MPTSFTFDQIMLIQLGVNPKHFAIQAPVNTHINTSALIGSHQLPTMSNNLPSVNPVGITLPSVSDYAPAPSLPVISATDGLSSVSMATVLPSVSGGGLPSVSMTNALPTVSVGVMPSVSTANHLPSVSVGGLPSMPSVSVGGLPPMPSVSVGGLPPIPMFSVGGLPSVSMSTNQIGGLPSVSFDMPAPMFGANVLSLSNEGYPSDDDDDDDDVDDDEL